MEYFTIAEFREYAADASAPQKFSDPDIERTEGETVERLEAWARTSWKLRTVTEEHYVDSGQYILRRSPIVALTSFTWDGAVQVDGYTFDADAGIVRFGNWSNGVPILPSRSLVIFTYTYGFDQSDVDEAVKVPCMQAARTRLLLQEGRAKLPRDISSYGSERTQVQKRSDRGLIKPWSWDERASQDIRSFWEGFRARGYMG